MTILFLSGCGLMAGTEPSPPKAERGVLDLTNWSFAERGSVALKGEWEFYWLQLLSPDRWTGSSPPAPTGMINLPHPWNGYKVEGKPIGSSGYATFRLRVLLPESSDKLAVRIPSIDTSFRLWADEREIARAGEVGTSRDEAKPQYLTGVGSLTPARSEVTLTLQIANFEHRHGGQLTNLTLGEEQQVTSRFVRSGVAEMCVAGGLLLIGIHYIGLYLLRRSDRAPLYLGLFCSLLGIRTFFVGNALVTRLMPEWTWTWNLRIEYLSAYLALPLFMCFIGCLFPQETDRRVVRTLPFAAGLPALTVLFMEADTFTRTLVYVQLLTAASAVYILYVLARASVRRREGAIIAFIGSLVYFPLVTHSILFYNSWVGGTDYSAYGLIFFVLMHSFIISVKSARAYHAEAVMSTELKQMNTGLEAKIKERTDALEQSYKRLEKIHDELARVENSRRRLMSNISHDLGTPMTLIQGYVEALLDGVADEPAQQKKYLGLIHSRVLGLNRLIADLFELSKLEARQIGFHFQQMEIGEWISHVNNRYELEIVGAGFQYSIYVDGPSDTHERCVRIDIDRVDQVLTNIIYNAMKHTPAGGDIRLRFDLMDLEQLSIEVTDSGDGIDPEDVPHIFERFYKKDKSRNTSVGGSGLGLAISKEIVEFHGGHIGVFSEPQKGSTFYFTLPVYGKDDL